MSDAIATIGAVVDLEAAESALSIIEDDKGVHRGVEELDGEAGCGQHARLRHIDVVVSAGANTPASSRYGHLAPDLTAAQQGFLTALGIAGR